MKKHIFVISFVFIIYILLLTFLSREGFPKTSADSGIFPYLSDRPLGDDAFYMFEVAENIAKGNGISYKNQPTSGIQPLVVFLYAGIFKVISVFGGSKWAFLRAVILVWGIIFFVFSILLSKTIQNVYPKTNVFFIAFLITLFNYNLFRWTTYGLETGLYLLLITIIINLLTKQKLTPAFEGFLFGITSLIRIDFLVISSFFLLFLIISKKIKFKEAILIMLIQTVIVSPWFIRNEISTGLIFPTSGIAESSTLMKSSISLRSWRMVKAVISLFIPFLYGMPFIITSSVNFNIWGQVITGEHYFAVALFLLSLFLIYIGIKREDFREVKRVFQSYPRLYLLTLSMLPLIPIYAIFFWSTHFYQRYLLPLSIPLTLIITIVIANGIFRQKKIKQVMLYIFIPLSFFFWSSFHMRRVGVLAILTGFVKEHFNKEMVGGFETGVLGFFYDNTVNLDGKMNIVVLSYFKKGNLTTYVDSIGINIIVDKEEYFGLFDRNWLKEYWELYPIQPSKGVCYVKKTFLEKQPLSHSLKPPVNP